MLMVVISLIIGVFFVSAIAKDRFFLFYFSIFILVVNSLVAVELECPLCLTFYSISCYLPFSLFEVGYFAYNFTRCFSSSLCSNDNQAYN